MKECPFCRSQVPDAAHYCKNCGNSFDTDEGGETGAESAAEVRIETNYVPGRPDTAIVKVYGYCDHHYVNKLKAKIEKLRADNPQTIVFDLSETEGLCSMALSLLISFFSDREDKKKNSTALACLHKNVKQVIDCLGIGRMLPIFATVKDALTTLWAK